MEARRVIEGELRNIGVHGLSNSGLTGAIRASPAVKCLLQWIFPVISAIFILFRARIAPVKLQKAILR